MEVPTILLNKILSEGIKKGATSFHLSIGSLPMIRVDDQLSSLENENIVSLDIINGIINSFISEEEVNQLKENKEVVLVKDFPGGLRFKINIFYQKNLPALSFHYIPAEIKSFSDLKLPQTLTTFTNLEAGLLVIAGPYSSGKTTTAASFIEEVNKSRHRYIVTLENPIEYQYVSKKSIINQRQIGRDVKTIGDGLEFCLNEDIDLLYIGDITEDFTDAIPIILNLAAGNSLVILELNANNSVSAIKKILNAAAATSSHEAARYSLADVLVGLLVQRLFPRRGSGLILASEFLLANSAVKSLIREGKLFQIESIIQTSRREGMISMEKSIEDLVRSGEIKQEST